LYQITGYFCNTTADPRVEKIGDISYLIESESGKVIYSFTAEFGGNATVSIGTPLSEDAMERTRCRARAFPVDGTLAKVANLLIESQETGTNELRAFIAAWSSLEIFVSAMFKAVYGRSVVPDHVIECFHVRQTLFQSS
jgi:hypothetical protein